MIINAKKRLSASSSGVTSVTFSIQPKDKELLDILKTTKAGDVVFWQDQEFYALNKNSVARFQNHEETYQIITIEGNKGTVTSLDTRLIKNMIRYLG